MTREEMILISKIVDRAYLKMKKYYNDKIDLFMDVEATHKNCPLNLQKLLEADDLNFDHDIIGICINLNRETKKLENCFVPRYAE